MDTKKFTWHGIIAQLTVVILTLVVSFTAAAAPNGGGEEKAKGDKAKNTMVGSWFGTTVINGQTVYGMATFSSDGTFIHTGAGPNNVQAHGLWKKVGPRTFVEQNREFVYQNEQLAFFADTTSVITLSEDGMSAISESVVEIKLLDGVTVLQAIPLTVHSTRMILDP